MARDMGSQIVSANLGSYANSLTTGQEDLIFYNNTGETIRILGAWLSGAATANSTSYHTVYLKDEDGATICYKALSSGTFHATNPVALSTPDTTYRDIADGDFVYVQVDHTDTGVGQAITRLRVTFEYEYVRAY